MRRFGLTLLLSAFLLLLLPVPASAFWRWLDELSGPGPWKGVDFDVRLYCWSEPVTTLSGDTALGRFGQKYKFPQDRAIETRSVYGIGVQTPCILGKRGPNDLRTASFHVSLGRQTTDRTNLEYEVNPEARRELTVYSVRPSFWYRLARSADIGAGGGVYVFDGDGFERFTRISIEPLMMDLKPFALVRDMVRRKQALEGIPDSQLDQFLTLRIGLTILQGLTAEKFGARPGTFDADVDTVASVSILLDFESLHRRLRFSRN